MCQIVGFLYHSFLPNKQVIFLIIRTDSNRKRAKGNVRSQAITAVHDSSKPAQVNASSYIHVDALTCSEWYFRKKMHDFMPPHSFRQALYHEVADLIICPFLTTALCKRRFPNIPDSFWKPFHKYVYFTNMYDVSSNSSKTHHAGLGSVVWPRHKCFRSPNGPLAQSAATDFWRATRSKSTGRMVSFMPSSSYPWGSSCCALVKLHPSYIPWLGSFVF